MKWSELKGDVEEALATSVDATSVGLDKMAPLLMVGCGNSAMGYDMSIDGYSNVVNIDYSDVVVDKCRERYPDLEYHCVDVREMNIFPDSGFQYVIDKGT